MSKYAAYDGVMQAFFLISIPEFLLSPLLYDIQPFVAVAGSLVEGVLATVIFRRILRKLNSTKECILQVALGTVFAIGIVGLYLWIIIQMPVSILPRRGELGAADGLMILVCVKQFLLVHVITRIVLCYRWFARRRAQLRR